jgi:hypothetical protein
MTLRDLKPPISEIEPNLFIGNVSSSLDPDLIRSKGIIAIVSLLDAAYTRRHDPEVQKLVPPEDQLLVPCEDSSTMDLLDPMAQICDFIDSRLQPYDDSESSNGDEPRTGGVLVHCEQGVSRAPTVVIAYLMRKHGKKLDEVLGEVEKRRRVNPSGNFINQLRAWQDVEYQIWEDEKERIPKRPYEAYLEGREDRMNGARLTNLEALEFINS